MARRRTRTSATMALAEKIEAEGLAWNRMQRERATLEQRVYREAIEAGLSREDALERSWRDGLAFQTTFEDAHPSVLAF
jgi:hypothetical protein